MLSRVVLAAVVLGSSLACSSASPHDRYEAAEPPRTSDVRHAVALTREPASLFRLGDEVVLARAGKIERVTPRGDVEPLAIEGMPEPARVMSRVGHEVTSGATTALLGESLASLWVGWSTYSVFGNTTILGIEGGRARCVGMCGQDERDPEPWSDRPPEEYEGSGGELRSWGGRGHLFVVTNLVSGENDRWIALPDPIPRDRAEAVAQRIEVGSSGVAFELADGTIVHVDQERAMCLSRGVRTAMPLTKAGDALPWRDSVAALGCRDVAILTAPGELWRERDGVATRIPAPLAAEHLRVADDGSLWVTGNRQEAHRDDGGAWRPVRWTAPPDAHDAVVAITREALFVRRSLGSDQETILRVPL